MATLSGGGMFREIHDDPSMDVVDVHNGAVPRAEISPKNVDIPKMRCYWLDTLSTDRRTIVIAEEESTSILG